MEQGIYSAIDANANRALEGIRVCEDIFRFIIRSSVLSAKLKEARHELADALKVFPRSGLLHGRDVENDTQKFVDLGSEKTRSSLSDIAGSNLHRATEAMRSIEEFFKLLCPGSNENPFQKIRFKLYSIDKEMASVLMREDKRRMFHSSLYAILDSSFIQNDEYAKTVERLIAGGASIIQLRMKNCSMGKILDTAKSVSRVCGDNNVLFIVNDYPEIAYLSSAGGVHLGQDDLPVADARRLLPPDMIVGISTHSKEEALLAAQSEPDYIAVGPVYDTKTKYNKLLKGIGEDVFKDILNSIEIPVVAIGGLDPERISELRKLGCNCGAVVSYLYKENRVEENCRLILNAIKA